VATDKTPLHVVLRGILESRNIGEAIEAVGRCGIGSAANFLVAQHGNVAVDIEAVPSQVDVLLPERDMLTHTNHLQSLRLAVLGVHDLSMFLSPDSYPRLARVRRLMDDNYGHVDVTVAQEILRDHANQPDSICRHEDEVGDPEGKRMQSVFSLVMDLAAQEFSITDGPPCSCEFSVFRGRRAAALA
jgi:isopenicillin-N N-acyltransferase like protein